MITLLFSLIAFIAGGYIAYAMRDKIDDFLEMIADDDDGRDSGV